MTAERILLLVGVGLVGVGYLLWRKDPTSTNGASSNGNGGAPGVLPPSDTSEPSQSDAAQRVMAWLDGWTSDADTIDAVLSDAERQNLERAWFATIADAQVGSTVGGTTGAESDSTFDDWINEAATSGSWTDWLIAAVDGDTERAVATARGMSLAELEVLNSLMEGQR